MYKLLVVDDEYIVRKGIISLVGLHKAGLGEIFEAVDGEEALEMYIEHKPDIVLADINMPRKNGLELVKEIKEINPNCKVIIISGYDYFDYAVSALRLGADDYVLKPVSKKDIDRILSEIIEKLDKERVEKQIDDILGESLENIIEEKEEIEVDLKDREKIKKYLDEKVSDSSLNLTKLSKEMGFSLGYISSYFKKLFGVSFKEYVLNIRMERAKLLLLATTLKNYEVAERVGYDDANYFSNIFKKRVGISPKKYKEYSKNNE